MARLRTAALMFTAIAVSSACASDPADLDPEVLPPLGQAVFTLSYVGSENDTTWNHTATAITYQSGCIRLVTPEGQETSFLTQDGERPGIGTFPLRGLAAPREPGTLVVYSFHNGYSSNITGSVTVLRSTPTEIGGTFDFSAPTEWSPRMTRARASPSPSASTGVSSTRSSSCSA